MKVDHPLFLTSKLRRRGSHVLLQVNEKMNPPPPPVSLKDVTLIILFSWCFSGLNWSESWSSALCRCHYGVCKAPYAHFTHQDRIIPADSPLLRLDSWRMVWFCRLIFLCAIKSFFFLSNADNALFVLLFIKVLHILISCHASLSGCSLYSEN